MSRKEDGVDIELGEVHLTPEEFEQTRTIIMQVTLGDGIEEENCVKSYMCKFLDEDGREVMFFNNESEEEEDKD